jgi:hypothetical protein
VKTADGLRHAKFFKEKQYAIIYDDLYWKSENMTREGMLHLLSGEITTTSNIKHSTVLVPKETYRALTSNYSLHTTNQFQQEEQEIGSAITCFNRRLQEIQLGSKKLFEQSNDTVSGSILLEPKKIRNYIKKKLKMYSLRKYC